MKKLIINLFFFLSIIIINSVFGQIRSDFLLVESGTLPCLIIDKDNQMHVTWRDSTGHVVYGLFDSLGYQMKQQEIISQLYPRQPFPRIAINNTYAIVAWISDPIYSSDIIYGQLLTTYGDTINDNFMVNDFSKEFGTTDVVFLTDSTFFVVWNSEQTGSGGVLSGIYGQIFTSSLNPVGSNLLLNDDVLDFKDRLNPRISSHLNSTNVAVTWCEKVNSSNYKVYGRLFSKTGIPVSSTFLISDNPDTSYIWNSSLEMDNDGEFIVVWNCGSITSDSEVYLRRFNENGIPKGPCEKINNNSSLYDATVDIAIDMDGKHIVVWEQDQSGCSKIVSQRYLKNGEKDGMNFFVSSSTDTFQQFWPSVSIHNGNIYTAWVKDINDHNNPIYSNIIDYNNPPSQITDNGPRFIPDDFSLYQNYPNPFNPETKIVYSLPIKNHVTLKVYNLLGEEIKSLVNEQQDPGKYEIVWDGSDFSSGIYLYRLKAGNFIGTKKMILQK